MRALGADHRERTHSSSCQGVPVVLPYSSPSPTPDGWDLFNSSIVQHGPAALLGEPYVYSLSLSASADEAIATIKRAAATPIDRFVPPNMTAESVDRRLMGVLAVDWERLAREKQGGDDNVDEDDAVVVGAGMLSECRRLLFCAQPDEDEVWPEEEGVDTLEADAGSEENLID